MLVDDGKGSVGVELVNNLFIFLDLPSVVCVSGCMSPTKALVVAAHDGGGWQVAVIMVGCKDDKKRKRV